MLTKKAVYPFLLLVFMYPGCSQDSGEAKKDAGSISNPTGDADTDQERDLDELEAFYQLMQSNALDFGFSDGNWTEDMGDAPFYGTGFFVRMMQQNEDEAYRVIAEAARDYNLDVLQDARSDFAFFVENLEEVIMAALGLIEYANATGDTDFIGDIDLIIDITNDALALFNDYLQDTGLNSWALQVYGPTAITAAVALLNLQYASCLDTDLKQDRIQRASEIIAAIDANALQVDSSNQEYYLFQPGVADLYLYPNTMMILVLNRYHESTGLVEPLQRAESIFYAIQPLKNTARGGYNSPYSAAVMGATTDDFTTLSSQNYLLLALSILYRNTDDQRYLDEAMEVFDFIRNRLYDQDNGIILHHWIDGRPALPEDPEYVCSGCNLQFLYAVWFFLESVSNGAL